MPGPRQQDLPDDLYERLGVARGADAREIRRGYLDLVARYHPDRHQGNPLGNLAQDKLAEINAAYDVLSDPARRAAYDAGDRSSRGAAASRGAATGGPRAQPPEANRPSERASPRRNPGRTLITLVVIGLSALLGLRLAPRIAGFFAALVGPGPGRIVAPVVLAAIVAIIIWARARRSR